MKLKELIRRIELGQKERCPFPDDLETYLEDFVPNTLLKSETLQQAFEVLPYEMEEIYTEAYSFYQEDEYLESSTAFRWLVLLNPFVPKYWMGLAASLQLLQKQTKALHAYAMAALLDCENPYPHFHAYECYASLNNKEDAEKALECAFQRTIGKDAYRDLQEEINHVLRSTYNRSPNRNLSVCV